MIVLTTNTQWDTQHSILETNNNDILHSSMVTNIIKKWLSMIINIHKVTRPYYSRLYYSLHKKIFLFKKMIFLVNKNKSAVFCGFVPVY